MKLPQDVRARLGAFARISDGELNGYIKLALQVLDAQTRRIQELEHELDETLECEHLENIEEGRYCKGPALNRWCDKHSPLATIARQRALLERASHRIEMWWSEYAVPEDHHLLKEIDAELSATGGVKP